MCCPIHVLPSSTDESFLLAEKNDQIKKKFEAMLSFNEFHSWLSIRPIELLLILFGWFSFTVLLVLRHDFHLISINWFHLFLPLFLSNGIHFYFILIVLLRIWFESKHRSNLSSAHTCRLILQKVFLHLPLILCLIFFNYFLFKAIIQNEHQSAAINAFVHCLVPLYLFIGWMFLKIFLCKKSNNVTVVLQS